jgi:hypothetical protein
VPNPMRILPTGDMPLGHNLIRFIACTSLFRYMQYYGLVKLNSIEI